MASTLLMPIAPTNCSGWISSPADTIATRSSPSRRDGKSEPRSPIANVHTTGGSTVPLSSRSRVSGSSISVTTRPVHGPSSSWRTAATLVSPMPTCSARPRVSSRCSATWAATREPMSAVTPSGASKVPCGSPGGVVSSTTTVSRPSSASRRSALDRQRVRLRRAGRG